MNVDLYLHEMGYLIVARNKFDEKCEMVSSPGDHIYEYVQKTGRLNVSYIRYWLTKLLADGQLDDDRKAFLDFVNKANDHRRVKRKTRPEGWRELSGLSTGEVPRQPKRPGDVVVHGDVARAEFKIL